MIYHDCHNYHLGYSNKINYHPRPPGGVRRSGEVQQGFCDDIEDDNVGQKLMA